MHLPPMMQSVGQKIHRYGWIDCRTAARKERLKNSVYFCALCCENSGGLFYCPKSKIDIAKRCNMNKTKPQDLKPSYNKTFTLLGASLVLCIVLSLTVGRYGVPLIQTFKILLGELVPVDKTWTDSMENVVLNVRLPRIIAAVLVGASLSVSGVAYQGVFRNPLVSPDLLGVSAGACAGAALAILLHMNLIAVQLCALLAGLLAVFITTLIPKMFRNDSTLMLILAGVIVTGFMSAVLGLLKYVADPEQELASIVYWTMGSFASTKKNLVWVLAPAILISWTVLVIMRWKINILSLGDTEAKSLGVNVRLVRGVCIVCATTATACAVCMSGTIGWLGLVVPHLGRLVVGNDNRQLIPAGLLLGASFMVLIDLLARNLTGSEIPVSILTGIIGVPVFMLLMALQKKEIS